MNKALKTTGYLLCGTIFVFTVLHLTGMMQGADNVFISCLCALMFVQGFEKLRVNRILAGVSFTAGTFMLIIIVFHFIEILTAG